MLKPVLDLFSSEINAIERQTRQILKNCGGYAWDSPKFPQEPEQRYWMPALCMLSAHLLKANNTKVFHLAGVLHLFNLASYLHISLPEDFDAVEVQEEIQYPILVGDLLYSRVCGDVCRYELQEYLRPLASLIGDIHEELVLRDAKAREGLAYKEHEFRIYGLLTECACFLGAHAVAGDTCAVEHIRKLGYQLGLLKAVWEADCEIRPYLENWSAAWSLCANLTEGMDSSSIQHILLSLGKKWNLPQTHPILGIKA